MLSKALRSLPGLAKPIVESRWRNKTRVVCLFLIIAMLSSCIPGGNQTQVVPTPTAQSKLPGCKPTDTDFCWPTATADLGNYADWLDSGCNSNTSYTKDKYHIGRDIKASVDAEVYAIAAGVVYDISLNGWKGETVGGNNVGLIIIHRLNDGSEFLAFYGHVITGLKKGDSVKAGQLIAKVGPYDYKDDKGNLRNAPHLHFGIHPNTTSVKEPYGRMPCSSWPQTNGFVDPIDWITTKSPLVGNVLGASATQEENSTPTAPVPVPGATPIRNLTPTPISYEPPPLDRQDYYSVLQWIKYAIETNDMSVFTKLVAENLAYVLYIEGGEDVTKDEFLRDLSKRLPSRPHCDSYAITGNTLDIQVSRWSPAWVIDEMCYGGCGPIDPPITRTVIAFSFRKDNNGWHLNKILFGTRPDSWASTYNTQIIGCDTVQLFSVASSPTILSNLQPLNRAEYFSVLQWIKYAALNNDISVFEKLIEGDSIQLIDSNGKIATIGKSDFLAELSRRLFNKPNCDFFMLEESGRLVIRMSGWSPGWGVDGNTIVYLILEMRNNQWVLTSIIYGDHLPSWAQGLDRISFDTISLSAGTTTGVVCQEARPTRLKIGDFAFVSFYPPLRQRIRSGPGTSNSILELIPVGSAVKILDGPECADNWVWWKVRVLSSKLEGWTAEGDADAYWLIPCASREGCGTQ